MLEKIITLVKENDMFTAGDEVICGLSGGADSCALLLALNELSGKLGIKVSAFHVNHCIRGAESDRDEEFCRELCRKYDIPFKAVSCDVPAYAAENSLSDEEAARKLRYAAFAENSSGRKIATAHNADDNLETVILNIARGTALKGLAGIPPVRGDIVRPLLTVTRREIEDYLREKGQGYVTDSTNLSDDYTRNKIRHRIIPVLREINPSVVETSAGSVKAVRAENSLIEEETDKAYSESSDGSSFTGLEKYHSVIRRRCIARLLTANSLPYSQSRLEKADRIVISGGKLNISGDIYFVSDGKTCGLKTIKKHEQQSVSTELSEGENSIYPGKKVLCSIVECDSLKKFHSVHKKLTFYLLDYDKIKGRTVLHNRRFGDRIQLEGKNFTSSVKKLINEKIPPGKRSTLHFISDDEGLIFAEMLGVAKRAAPDKNTVKFMVIAVCGDNDDTAGLIVR